MMIPNDPYIVCKADLEQKKKHTIPGTDIELYIETDYSDNMREKNPNYAEVVYSGGPGRLIQDQFNPYKKVVCDLIPGDIVCMQHFQLVDHERNSLHRFEENGDKLYLVNFNEVYFKLVDGKPEMMPHYLLAKKVPDDFTTSIPDFEMPDIMKKTYHQRRAVITYISDDIIADAKDLKVGDKIIYLPYADYGLDINGEEFIKLRDDEILGTYE